MLQHFETFLSLQPFVVKYSKFNLVTKTKIVNHIISLPQTRSTVSTTVNAQLFTFMFTNISCKEGFFKDSKQMHNILKL